jgi:putative transposase
MLKEQEAGAKTADVCRKHGISAATFYKFKAKFGGMEVSDARRLKALEDENARLKKLLTEQMLDNAILKDVAAKNGDARCQAGGGGSCLRGAWGEQASGVPGSEHRPFDGALHQHLSGRRSVAGGDEGSGGGAPAVRLPQDPHHAGPAGYRDEPEEAAAPLPGGETAARRRGGRKRALGTRRPMLVPDRANTRWSLDFVSDTFTDGRRFRVLAIVDDYTRECLALITDTSLSGLRVVREMDAVICRRGRSDTIVSDNGTELTSMAVLRCSASRPPSNGTTSRLEAYTECLRGELPGALLGRVPERHAVLDAVRSPQRHHSWKKDYNHHRLHSALGNMPPAEFAMKSTLEKQAA